MKNIHPDLLGAQKLVYDPCGLVLDKMVNELESEEYGATEFEINLRPIRFRVAKITPTKIGQFVTLWKRIGKGPIMPFDWADPIDFFIISVRHSEHFGQFIFPKSVLCEKGIVTKDTKEGKRAMRVYPPWDITDNRQASNTQAWQLLYFFKIPLAAVDVMRIKKLFEVRANL